MREGTDDGGREGHTLHGHLAVRDMRHVGFNPMS